MKETAICRKQSVLIIFIIVVMSSYTCVAQEICNNGKDDDNDGLTDLADPECQCHFAVSGNLLSNGSFESYRHCPATYTYDSEYNIAYNWAFASYTNINEATFYHNLDCSADTAQVMRHMPPALPLPDGKGFVGIYNSAYLHPVPDNEMMKGYISQCLATPLTKGEDYTLSFYAGRFRSWDNLTGTLFPFEVAVFGNADCNAVPFGKKYVQGNGCPAGYTGWILLGNTTMHSNGQWVQGKVHLTVPSTIKVIAVGPGCAALPPLNDLTDSTTFLDYHLYYLDDLHLLKTKDFPFQYIHVQASSNCNSLPLLQAPVTAGATYQWYKDSSAIQNATSATYQVEDSVGHYYNVSITTSEKCSTSEPLLIVKSQLDKVNIPSEAALCSNNDTLQLAPVLSGIQYMVNGTISNSVTLNQEGNYTIVATDINGCQKVFNTQVTKQNCTDCEAAVPTAFTPNSDGLNDVFKAKLACIVVTFRCRIFDRWGTVFFESKDVHKGWDGTYKGRKMAQGIYVYSLYYKTISGVSKASRGVVVLIQ